MVMAAQLPKPSEGEGCVGAAPRMFDRLNQQVEAFQELLGLEALPQSGTQAQQASRLVSSMVLAGVAAPPVLSQLVAERLSAFRPNKPRFVDVSTGLRLRYLEWGSGADVVLLLHDIGESADIWLPLAPRLADRGYHVFALDMRGHGESGRSLDCRYSADMLAEDVKAFIIAKDLYVAPIALVGCGMGAAVGLTLVQQNPFLAGALLAAEFALPVAALRQAPAATGRQAEMAAQAAAEGATDQQAATQEQQSANSSSNGLSAVSSKELLPWWGFRVGQASQFASVEQCAAFLAHPLANLAPELLLPLRQAAQQAASPAGHADLADRIAGSGAQQTGDHQQQQQQQQQQPPEEDEEAPSAEPQPTIQELFSQLQRPLRGAVASACSLLRLPPELERNLQGCWDGYDDRSSGVNGGKLQPRMDPSFHFSFDAAALLAGLAGLRCHLLLLHGARSGWVDTADAAAMAAAAAEGGAASAAAAALSGAGHWLAADHPDQLLKQIVAFLEGPAVRCFDRRALTAAATGARNSTMGNGTGHGSGSAAAVAAQAPAGACRRPELLDLRPLPQYASLEEARKALGPRAIPSAAAVEEELRKLRVEEGRAPDDDSSGDEDEEQRTLGKRRTGLAKEPADYFGFVG